MPDIDLSQSYCCTFVLRAPFKLEHVCVFSYWESKGSLVQCRVQPLVLQLLSSTYMLNLPQCLHQHEQAQQLVVLAPASQPWQPVVLNGL